MRFFYTAFLALMFVPSFALASEFTSENEARKFSDKITMQILNEEFEKAFNAAKPYWPLPPVEIDGLINQIRQQWPIVQQRFGDSVGMEFVREEKIGNSFLRYYYLHKFENHAIYWQLSFYKPSGGWKINSLVFLDDLNPLYQ